MPPSGSPAEADELAKVEARAQAARAHATRLRRQAEAASGDTSAPTAPDAADPIPPPRRRRLRPPGRKFVAAMAAVLVVAGSLTASGFIVWHHHAVDRQKQRAAEFTTAARNGVVMMLSMDSNKARDDLQRFADDTTGLFKAGVLMGAEDAVKAMEQSKISSKGSVQATAVDSMTDDSAIVLVAAKSESTKPGQAKPDSRSLRLVISLQRDGGQLKISRVEFVQ